MFITNLPFYYLLSSLGQENSMLNRIFSAFDSKNGKLFLVQKKFTFFLLKFFIAQRCPPISGVEGSVDSYLRALGERERWNIDVLLRMLTELLPFIYRKAVDTCPFTPSAEPPTSPKKEKSYFSASFLKLYAT